MNTSFCQLTEKEVVNCTDGSIIGRITDLEICTDDCKITAIVVSRGSGLISKQESITIPWCQIEKIGCDVIIVNCAPIFPCECGPHRRDKRKMLFGGKN